MRLSCQASFPSLLPRAHLLSYSRCCTRSTAVMATRVLDSILESTGLPGEHTARHRKRQRQRAVSLEATSVLHKSKGDASSTAAVAASFSRRMAQQKTDSRLFSSFPSFCPALPHSITPSLSLSLSVSVTGGNCLQEALRLNVTFRFFAQDARTQQGCPGLREERV